MEIDVNQLLDQAMQWLNLPSILGGGFGAFLLYLAKRSFDSRIKTNEKIGEFFTNKDLMDRPRERPAYSDRVAYMLAEMADLAYYEFERGVDRPGIADEILARVSNLDRATAEQIVAKIEEQALTGGGGEAVLRELLRSNGFRLLGTFDRGEVQAFICKDERVDADPAIIVAFRGSEKKANDWIANANAAPRTIGNDGGEVHTGFHDSLMKVHDDLKALVESPEAREADGRLLPIYFTGHSLGGAWALLATTLIAPDRRGACYTYGAPRLANYPFFFKVKTPVYRVVNSADIVPRLPPSLIAEPIAWLLGAVGAKGAARWVNRLKDYRHFGDLRYLTDSKNKKFSDVQLLSNPPVTDQMLWFWPMVLASFGFPVKSHSMAIYRYKLEYLATTRQIGHVRTADTTT